LHELSSFYIQLLVSWN